MALEDKALVIIRRGAITYDGLRAELGAAPEALDTAIANLERAREIKRERGRFQAADAISVPTSRAAAVVSEVTPTAEQEVEYAMKQKVCSNCSVEKPLKEFPTAAGCKDGHAGQCKDCIAKKARERSIAKAAGNAVPQPRAVAIVHPQAALPPPSARRSESLMILHFADGVRIGPVVTSVNGLAQMPYHVDLSGDQLDQLTAWWAAAKRSAA